MSDGRLVVIGGSAGGLHVIEGELPPEIFNV
jgi:hypothetical protein